jgi:hypothetical protein
VATGWVVKTKKKTANRYLPLLHECAGRFDSIFEFDTEFDAVDYLIVLIEILGKRHYVVTTHSFPFDTHHKVIASSLERLSLGFELRFDLGPSTDFVVFGLVRHCD